MQTINENTPVRLGLLLSICSLIVASILGVCWWAASWTSGVNAKLDHILLQQQTISNSNRDLAQAIEDLRVWKNTVTLVGTPTAQELKKEISDLRREFELHKVTTKTP